MVMSLLKSGRHPMTIFTISLWTRNQRHARVYPLVKPCVLPIVVSPMIFHLILQGQSMFHYYVSISRVSSWSFPAALSVLVFHVPMVMLSLPRIFDDAPVARLTPPSWFTAEGAVHVDKGGDRSGILGGFSHVDSRAKYSLTEPIPLQGEHMAVEFIMEPFCPSGPSLLTMMTCARWCHFHTSYFTHKRKTPGGTERLIPSRTGPKGTNHSRQKAAA